VTALSGSFGGPEAGARGAAPTVSLSLSPESTPVMPVSRRLLEHVVKGVLNAWGTRHGPACYGLECVHNLEEDFFREVG
jgi:hypothetical protein